MARLMTPRVRLGATRASHRERPGATAARPRSLPTTTESFETNPPRWSSGLMWIADNRLGLSARVGSGERRRRRQLRRVAAQGSAGKRVVRLHDLLHELVSDDVSLVEPDEGNPLDPSDDLDRFHQPGRPARRQIDLSDVAGDDRFGAEAEPSQKHLHLL